MVHISEYESALCKEPCIISQVLEGSSVSKPFSKNTWFIKLRTDASCTVAFGDNPISACSDAPLAAGSMEVFPVQPGHKVAVLVDSAPSGGSMFDLLAVIADPTKAKARLDELTKATIMHNATLATIQGAADQLTIRSESIEKQFRELELAISATSSEKVKVQAASDMLKVQATELEHKIVAWNMTQEEEAKQLQAQKEANLKESRANYAAHEARVAAFENHVHDTLASIEAQKTKLKERENEVAAREGAVVKLHEDLKSKHARLKELAGVLA